MKEDGQRKKNCHLPSCSQIGQLHTERAQMINEDKSMGLYDEKLRSFTNNVEYSRDLVKIFLFQYIKEVYGGLLKKATR